MTATAAGSSIEGTCPRSDGRISSIRRPRGVTPTATACGWLPPCTHVDFVKGSMHPWIVLASHKISGLQGLAESHARLR